MLVMHVTPKPCTMRRQLLQRNRNMNQPSHCVSRQTIYRWLETCEYRSHFRSFLRHGRYRKRRGMDSRGRIRNRISIEERPADFDSRRRFGDWEGDTVHGAGHSGMIMTCVERKSGYLVAAKMQDGTSARLNAAKERAFRIPAIFDSPGVHIFIFTLNNRPVEEHQSDFNWRITIPPVRCSSQPFLGDSVGADNNDCSEYCSATTSSANSSSNGSPGWRNRITRSRHESCCWITRDGFGNWYQQIDKTPSIRNLYLPVRRIGSA